MRTWVRQAGLVVGLWVAFGLAVACGSSTHNGSSTSGGKGGTGGAGDASGNAAGSGGASSGDGATAGSTMSDAGSMSALAGAAGEAGSGGEGGATDDGADSCESAAQRFDYRGCEFWPTFVANPVWKTFAPGIGFASESSTPAEVIVDGPAGFHQTFMLAPGASNVITVPWVADLKGPEWSTATTSGGRITQSVRVDAGAYHVRSTFPIAVWQFNPLRYEQEADGCPNNLTTCRAASNDATSLMPVTSLTGNYRIFAYSTRNDGADWGTTPGGFAVTATADDTVVTLQAGLHCGAELVGTSELGPCMAAGTGLPVRKAEDVFQLKLNAGDVVQLIGDWAKNPSLKNADVSGSLINASKPVQVITFNSIAQVPDYSTANADHLEELLPPAETLGKQYVVVPPSTPDGPSRGHVVRIYGNVDGTKLTYPAGKPVGAPDVINAGEVVQIPPLPLGQPAAECVGQEGQCLTNTPFVVEGDEPFGVASFMPGGVLQSPGADSFTTKGDPAATFLVSPIDFASSYSFLIPANYSSQYADLVFHAGAQISLDGALVKQAPTAVGNSGWSFVRVPIAQTGVHRVSTSDSHGVGGQITAFGFATAIYYAAGSRQPRISSPPVIAK